MAKPGSAGSLMLPAGRYGSDWYCPRMLFVVIALCISCNFIECCGLFAHDPVFLLRYNCLQVDTKSYVLLYRNTVTLSLPEKKWGLELGVC